jgi:2-keto-4-pentenoate hydratase/2-oxohepta-3-ene-1,7-dioic acid hydratase in catechol pathway
MRRCKMRVVRFAKDDLVSYGIADGDTVRRIKGDVFNSYEITTQRFALDEVRLLAPCMPSKIVAVGLNYADHISEMTEEARKDPVLFIKPSTAVIGHKDYIVCPAMSQRVDYEGELAVVIGRRCKDVEEEDANDYIFGFTCFNDVTARDLQSIDGQWTRAKSFDTFAPMGPWIARGLDAHYLDLEVRVNGEVKQSSNTSFLLHNVEELVSFISKVMTLLPGDVIATGTPSGISPIKPGDVVEVEIEGIGVLENYVR